MIQRRRVFSALAFASLFVGSAGAQESPDSVRDLNVRELVRGLDGATASAIWGRSEALVRMGAPAAAAIRKAVPELGVEGKLAALRALIELKQPSVASVELVKMARDEKVALPHRLLALDLIGRAEVPEAEEELADLLGSFNPHVKIAAARALYGLGTSRSQDAKDALREVLKSSDPELRAAGAIALADIGDAGTPGVVETLREIAKEPGERGLLARALDDRLRLNEILGRLRAEEEAGTDAPLEPAAPPAAPRAGSGMWAHLDELRAVLESRYDTKEKLTEDQLRSLAAHGLLTLPNDPHTEFMNPEEHRALNVQLDPHYGGIGAIIDTDVKDEFRILRPFFGGPAWKADIRAGDEITAVNGVATEGRRTEEIIKQVKGPPGTPVVLTIEREGWAEPKDIEVIRARIALPTVLSRMLPGGIGYVAITQFGESTGRDFETQLPALEAEGMRGLVIDLRWNPGGLLASVTQCLTPFLKAHELVCTSSGRQGPKERHLSGSPDRQRPNPRAVLNNEHSASGAELMSGVLQHYSTQSEHAGKDARYVDALVLGKRSFGKGTMQAKYNLSSWPGEKFIDEPRKNGERDVHEHLLHDRNGNRAWDPGDTFVDTERPNGLWDEGEAWEDTNGNGACDANEKFADANGDGVWNGPERYEDENGNGVYDYGAAARLTIARYYLPGGRNFTREWVKKDGGYEWVGGVVPDIDIAPTKLLASHRAELQELYQGGKFREYVRSRWAKHKDAFYALAYEDGRDPSRYPDFDEVYRATGTRLTRQEFRLALRIEVRRDVSNDMGKEIFADLSDDVVLRRGCEEVLRRLGADPSSVPEFASIAKNSEP